MDNLDDKIKEMLSDDERTFLASLDDLPFTDKVLKAFDKSKYMPFLWVLLFVYSVLLFWCGYETFQATALRYQMLWMGGLFMATINIAMVKMWWWMRYQHNVLLREIKRSELQIASIYELIKNQKHPER